MAEGCRIAEAVETRQHRTGARYLFQELKTVPEVWRSLQFLIVHSRWRREAVAPETDVRHEFGELRTQGEVDLEAGAEDDEVGLVSALGCRDDKMVAIDDEVVDRASQLEMRVGVSGDPEHALARRRRLRFQRVVEKAPLPIIRQTSNAMHDALAADTGEFV